MRYLYNIAGAKILCSLPFQVHITDESFDFLQPLFEAEGNLLQNNENPDEMAEGIVEREGWDLHFCMEETEKLSALPHNAAWHGDVCFIDEGNKHIMYRRLGSGKEPYICVIREESLPREIKAYYLKKYENEVNYSRNLFDIINMETLLLDLEGLLLHTSFIRYHKDGILFSAPCGTGKSTQAELWNRYREAEVINGDRAALRVLQNEVVAYGLPYAGSSCIYRNEKATVRAIIVLQQAPKNTIRRLSARESFMHLYPEFTVHRFDVGFVDKVMGLIGRLLEIVPVYLLACTPDERAVKILEEELYKD